MSDQAKYPLVILRRKQVEAKTGLSRSSIYDRLNPKASSYDPSFPAPVSLGEKAVGWVESEIDQWITGRIAVSRGGAKHSSEPCAVAA
ncbi:AlpA family transcriptional regulator [Sulfuritalea hydrogenivorans]|uniref:Transcriptional regulator n=1 Tax=Sulfuritalea hydrogenivorans sk43H TaxID=1223802 RepID=W0SF49_9PROT|nr:AlpA family transcriptional regulator [Sulfuritalea hydrogenivorans]BAO29375.1 transcriptional regulator [Sulfuritalea hydrogenivorans sk43H]